jgi:hypothetical protein
VKEIPKTQSSYKVCHTFNILWFLAYFINYSNTLDEDKWMKCITQFTKIEIQAFRNLEIKDCIIVVRILRRIKLQEHKQGAMTYRGMWQV